jgi:prophage regulatory protein
MRMSEVKLNILRLKDVMARTGLSRSTIYAYIADKKFPKPFKIGERAVGWYEHEIDQWVSCRGGYTEGVRYETIW